MFSFLLAALFSIPSLAADVPGGLDKGVIDETVKKALPDISGCYDAEVKKAKKEISGSVSMKFTISPDGKVSEAKVAESTLKNEAIETCLANVIKATPFPAPAGGGVVEVSYPFAFAPSKEAKAKAGKKGK